MTSTRARNVSALGRREGRHEYAGRLNKVRKAEGQRKRELRRSLRAAKLGEKAAIEKAVGIC